MTLDQDHLRSTTTSRADPSFKEDALWLNGKPDEIKDGGRLATCIAEMRSRRRQLEEKNSDLPKVSAPIHPRMPLLNVNGIICASILQIADFHLHIASFNNFPTAAGLASSASGFAALVASLASLYELPDNSSELSRIARQGSGSACRSLFGGFVAWKMGAQADGSDSLAVEIAPQKHWPNLHALICVVSDDKKGTSSTSGMQRTVETSTLLQHRIKDVVPKRMEAISKAIKEKDFPTFAKITMADSNSFHAVALDTEPPIFYMNDVSRAIIAIIVEYNRASEAAGGSIKAAYTYDAGPNAVIYTEAENVKEIVQLILSYFPQKEPFKDVFELFSGNQPQPALPDGFNAAVAKKFEVGSVKGLIHTRIGDGPRKLGESESLLNAEGAPKTLA